VAAFFCLSSARTFTKNSYRKSLEKFGGSQMADPFLSEIRIFSFGFAPRAWAMCNGQVLPINQNQALFSLLGTTYGGNGQTNFALPNLQGRTPIHRGNGHSLGEPGGEQSHTLTQAEMPTHTHALNGTSTPADTNAPTGGYLATINNAYGPAQNLVAMGPTALTSTGGSQAHLNMQPYLTLNFCIALQGIFPSPS
jgi:microcystin-dependent protein